MRSVLYNCRAMLASMAALSLIVLVLQNSTLVLMTRYSKFMLPAAETYYTSTLVLNQEIMKMVFCVIIFWYEHRHEEQPVARQLYDVVAQRETLKLAVPAALFTLQNYLIFIALSHLDAMTFQVVSQTKLLSAAVFTVMLLDRRLTRPQWMSLLLLTLGVYLAQTTGQRESFTKSNAHRTHHQNTLLGIVSCVISGLSSSYAGVYFEKVVKTTAPSLAVRNIHLSLFGIPFAALSMIVLDVIPSRGTFRFWQGYNNWFTWGLVLIHALGGLLVAVVVKYADNILKGFATGIAIVVSGSFSSMFWGYSPGLNFVVGCTLVVASSVMYHVYDSKSRAQEKSEEPSSHVAITVNSQQQSMLTKP